MSMWERFPGTQAMRTNQNYVSEKLLGSFGRQARPLAVCQLESDK